MSRTAGLYGGLYGHSPTVRQHGHPTHYTGHAQQNHTVNHTDHTDQGTIRVWGVFNTPTRSPKGHHQDQEGSKT
jgi:hypothetical protein